MSILEYGDHPRQVIASYTSESSQPSTHALLFIHGGLWRAPPNTFKDWELIIDQLKTSPLCNDGFQFYSVDYRLVPDLKHPDHLQDVVDGIRQIVARDNIETLSICGHSCGATLALQLMNLKQLGLDDTNIPKIANLALLDGIYNVKSFAEEYAEWAPMVDEAFDDYSKVTPLNFEDVDLQRWRKLNNIIVVQSTEDELLSINQSLEFINWLKQHKITNYKFINEDFGLHDQVYQNIQVANILSTSLL